MRKGARDFVRAFYSLRRATLTLMLKTFRVLILFPVAFPTAIGILLTFYLAVRRARTDRKRAAWLLLRLATFVKRTTFSAPEKKPRFVATITTIAHLLQGAPWERLHPHSEGGIGAQTLAQFYLADGKLEDARQAALVWCHDTDEAVAQSREQMREFFAQHREELSPHARAEIHAAIRQKEELVHQSNPQNHPRRKWWVASQEVRDYLAHLNYYSAHLTLEGAQWLQSQADAPRRLARARPGEIETALGLPQVRVNEDWLRALGMEPDELEAARRRAMSR